MHSEVKSTSAEESLHCQPYLQDLDKLFDLFQERHEVIQKLCGRDLDQVKDICNVLVSGLAVPHLELTTKQKAASLLKTFLKYQMHNFHFIVQQHHTIFFNFSIQSKVKRIFSDSLFSLITKYTKELNGLFESSTHSLLNLLETLYTHRTSASNIYSAPPISIPTLPEPFSFTFQWPEDETQIFSTLVILGDVFLGNDAHPNISYKGELANLFRRLNKLLLTAQGLSMHLKEVDQLLEFWVGLANQSLVDEDDEPRRSLNEEEDQLKKRRMAGVMQMKSWGQFYDQLELVLDFLAPSQHFSEISLILHNYLAITQNWEQHGIFSTKSKAAEIISTLFMLINSADFREFENNPSLRELGIRLQWSIFQSLQALIKGPQINLKNLQIAPNFLELFCTLLFTHPQTFSDHQIIDLLGNSIIPILDFYLVETKDLFRQNVQECLAELEDCCQDHRRGTILGQLAKMVEAICDQNQPALQFLMQYIRYSFEQRQNAQLQSWTIPKSVIELKATSTEAALLLLGIISYKSATITSSQAVLKKIFVRPFINSLNEFQKGLFYNCMGYIMMDLFWDDESGLEDILMSTLEPMGCQLRYFAVNLISQTEVKFFSRQFISEFLSKFMQLGDSDEKWIALTHLVCERLQDFDESYLQSMIYRVKEEVLKLSEDILCMMNQGKNYNTSQVGNLLYFCMHVAENYQYCLKHPKLQQALWSVIDTLPTVSQLFLDDILIKIATELLTPVARLPGNFVNILSAVSQTFSCSEFQGVHFYAFLQTAIMASGNQQKNILDLIYLSLSEVFSYVLYFPEERSFEMILNLSNAIVSLQCLFLRHPTTIDEIQIEQIQKLCLETLQRKNLPELREYPLVEGRTVILLLLVQIRKAEKFTLDSILIKANQHCFMGADANLLLYILRENLMSIAAESRHHIFTVVIYCMRTEQYKKTLKGREDYLKLNNIYNYVERPVKLEYKLNTQAKSLINHFETAMPDHYHASFSKLRQSDIEALWNILNDNTPPSRKIVRVVGPNRGPALQPEQKQQHLPFIRGAAETWGETEEGQSRKRRKEKQATKYEMVKLKREKKGI